MEYWNNEHVQIMSTLLTVLPSIILLLMLFVINIELSLCSVVFYFLFKTLACLLYCRWIHLPVKRVGICSVTHN